MADPGLQRGRGLGILQDRAQRLQRVGVALGIGRDVRHRLARHVPPRRLGGNDAHVRPGLQEGPRPKVMVAVVVGVDQEADRFGADRPDLLDHPPP